MYPESNYFLFADIYPILNMYQIIKYTYIFLSGHAFWSLHGLACFVFFFVTFFTFHEYSVACSISLVLFLVVVLSICMWCVFFRSFVEYWICINFLVRRLLLLGHILQGRLSPWEYRTWIYILRNVDLFIFSFRLFAYLLILRSPRKISRLLLFNYCPSIHSIESFRVDS